MNKMRLLLNALVGILLFLEACQSDHKSAAAPSRIEAVRMARQVENLLRSVDTNFVHFTVDTALRVLDRRVAWQYRKAGVKAWEKADFDGNGRLDMLVTGVADYGLFYPQTSQVFCLMDMGARGLVLADIDRQRPGIGEYYCPVAKVVHQDSQPLVQYADYAPPSMVADSLQYGQSFLLTYRFGGFVEYNPLRQKTAAFDSIVYASDFAYDDFIHSKLFVAADGKATYHACEGPVLPEDGKTTCEQLRTNLDARTMREVRELMGYINPDSLRPRYRAYINHVPCATLTISYRGGRKVRVLDEGEQGTFGLMRLYALLQPLRKTQQWQPVK